MCVVYWDDKMCIRDSFGEVGGSFDGYIFPNRIHDFHLPFNLFLFEDVYKRQTWWYQRNY